MTRCSCIHPTILIVLFCLVPTLVRSDEATQSDNLAKLFNSSKQSVRDLAQYVEDIYNKINCTTAFQDCENKTSDWYTTRFPTGVCYDNKEFNTTCDCPGAIFDFNNSNVAFGKCGKGNLEDGQTIQRIESICYTRSLDDNFRTQFQYFNNTYTKDPFNIEVPPMYFGSQEGVFRIFPARYFNANWTCNFETRLRPWYISAIATPKNLILLVDISDKDKEELIKEAATVVIATLTNNDYVALVVYNDTTKVFGDESSNLMMEANDDNKKYLTEVIHNISFGGKNSNLGLGLNATIETLYQSLSSTSSNTNDCSNAIIVLASTTDADNDGSDTRALFQTIKNRTGEDNTFLFLISVGEDENNNAYDVHKRVSNIDKGYWTSITNSYGIVDSLYSYFQIFAPDNQESNPENGTRITGFSNIYLLATGSVNGITVFAPVFRKNPDSTLSQLLVGVVGLSLTQKAMESIYPSGWNESLQQEVRKSTLKSCKIFKDWKQSDFRTFRRESFRDLTYQGASNCFQVHKDFRWFLNDELRNKENNQCCEGCNNSVPSPVPSPVIVAERNLDKKVIIASSVIGGTVVVLLASLLYWRTTRGPIYDDDERVGPGTDNPPGSPGDVALAEHFPPPESLQPEGRIDFPIVYARPIPP